MTQFFSNRPDSKKVRELRPTTSENPGSSRTSEMGSLENEYAGMRLIPWREIWASLTVAKVRSNGQMVEVFYDTLFKDAVFDDRGAWSVDVRKRN
jgi:hypothetical protein